MAKIKTRKLSRAYRHRRIREKVSGTKQRPRLSVFRSPNHIYAQLIDDAERVTIATSSSLESDVRKATQGKHKDEASKLVGALIAKRAVEQNVKSAVFDRGGYKYHGRIKTLAESARDGGLRF